MEQSMIPEHSQECQQWEFYEHGENAHGNFLDGMIKVQMFQMNQSHNDDVMNVNR